MDPIILFLQERWYVLVIGLVLLFITFKVIKTVLKWIIFLAIVGVIVIYALNYRGELENWTSSIHSRITSEVKQQAVQAMRHEAQDARYKANADGSFSVTTKNLQVEVLAGSMNAEVTYMGQTFSIPIDSVVQGFIDHASGAKE